MTTAEYISRAKQVKQIEKARKRLQELRNQLLERATHGVWHDGEAYEWARLNHAHRMMVMLLAGMDGDLDVLAARAWREFTPPERQAIKTEIRMVKRTFSRTAALCTRMS